MPIRSEDELTKCVQEFQKLHGALPNSPEAKRRDELSGQINQYYLKHVAEMRSARAEDTSKS